MFVEKKSNYLKFFSYHGAALTGNQLSENRCQRTEDREQRTENRNQKIEVGKLRRSEVIEFGSRKGEVGNQKIEAEKLRR